MKSPRTGAEEAEFQKLKRIDNLAWDYDASHRYMLEKNSYSSQDVDYAFSLEKMENKVKTSGPMMNSFASGIYKSLILEKIFGGVSQRIENDFTAEDVKDQEQLKTWLDNDMCACIQHRPDEMKTVIKSLKKAKPELTREELLEELLLMIKTNWIKNVFSLRVSVKIKDKQNPMKYTGESIPKAFDKLAQGSELKKKLAEAIKQVFISDLSQNLLIELD